MNTILNASESAPNSEDSKNGNTVQSAPAQEYVPAGMRIAAAWSWRLLLVGAAIAVTFWLIAQVSTIVIPLFIAVLLAALLQPIVQFAVKIGLPRWLGMLTALTVMVSFVSLLVWLIVINFQSGFDALGVRIQLAWNDFTEWLTTSPLPFDLSDFKFSVSDAIQTIRENQNRLLSGALGFATTAGQIMAGALLVIFSLIFLLIDGKKIWFWVLGFLPAAAHAPVNEAAKAGWESVGHYVRVQILVAFVDAVGIALGAWILGVPLVIPIGISVFLASFIPFLGAITTGVLACVIALVYNGPTIALLMLAVVVLVNQIEGNVMQPLVMGNAVSVHPLGVVLAVTMGAMFAGIAGALFAVPIAACANSMVNTLASGSWRGLPDPVKIYHADKEQERDKRAIIRELARKVKRRS
ncbi:AI-2E family transporter [Canibacter zhuwentaonis]|uniref:AI-2E family transporter n=1 Tax=Canibacter zhuwentaonis TaxID=2837491 RepID=UPI0032B353C3